PQNDVTLKMPAFEWVHVQLHQQKGMISLSPPTICNSASLGMTESGWKNRSLSTYTDTAATVRYTLGTIAQLPGGMMLMTHGICPQKSM
ncbi:hypothetical protein SLK74_24085, partial [Enterobacter asburiae]